MAPGGLTHATHGPYNQHKHQQRRFTNRTEGYIYEMREGGGEREWARSPPHIDVYTFGHVFEQRTTASPPSLH